MLYINYNYNSIWFITNVINNYKTPTKQTAIRTQLVPLVPSSLDAILDKRPYLG